MMEPAKSVIEICGGVKAVAEIVGRSETRVRRWGYPKDRGGTEGLVPAECQVALIEHARKTGLPLRPDHFFPDQEDAA